jgi:hypothetical protein
MVDFAKAAGAYKPRQKKVKIERDRSLDELDESTEQFIKPVQCPCYVTDSYGGITVWHLDLLGAVTPLFDENGRVARVLAADVDRVVNAMRFRYARY